MSEVLLAVNHIRYFIHFVSAGVSSQVRHRPVPLNMRSHPEESRVRAMSSPVSGAPPQAVVDPGVYREMDLVLSGLVEFKDELLQLHSLVSLF